MNHILSNLNLSVTTFFFTFAQNSILELFTILPLIFTERDSSVLIEKT